MVFNAPDDHDQGIVGERAAANEEDKSHQLEVLKDQPIPYENNEGQSHQILQQPED